jgi:hypothetical protein
MRRVDGHWHCTLCGAILDIPVDEDPDVIIKSAGGQPTVRTLNIGGKEIHRCTLSGRPLTSDE